MVALGYAGVIIAFAPAIDQFARHRQSIVQSGGSKELARLGFVQILDQRFQVRDAVRHSLGDGLSSAISGACNHQRGAQGGTAHSLNEQRVNVKRAFAWFERINGLVERSFDFVSLG